MIEQHKYDGGITGWWCRYEYPNGKQCGEHRGNTAVHLPDAPEMLNRTIPFEGQALFPKADPPQYKDYPPEMLDARLYVFDCQNFVSEKDYRAMMQLAEGFRLERNIMQEMAMKAKAEVERWKKKAELHAFEIQKRIVNAHGQGYEAGRREGLEEFAQRAEGFTSPWYSPEEIAAIVRIYVEDMQRKAQVINEAREAGRREGDHKWDAAYTAYFRLKRLLGFLDRLGGLGLDVHDYIRLELSQTEADYQKALIDSPKAEGEAAASRHGFHAACGTFHDLSICHVGAPAEAEGEEP